MPRPAASRSARRRPARPSSPSSSRPRVGPRSSELRLVSTGTEATMTRHPPRARRHRPRPAREVRRALPRPLRRAARRGRLGPRDVRAARARPACPPTIAALTLVLPYNDLDAVARGVRRARRPDRRGHHRGGRGEHGRRAARVPASTARSSSSRTRTARCVISDEVLTGFRVSAAGWWGLEHGHRRRRTRPTS